MHKIDKETLDESRLQKVVEGNTLARGHELFSQGHVRVLELKEKTAECVVQEKRPHQVGFKIANNYLYLKCDCRHAIRGLVCEHEVAAWLGLLSTLRRLEPPAWQAQINRIVESSPAHPPAGQKSRYLLFFSLQSPLTSGFPNWRVLPYVMPGQGLPDDLNAPAKDISLDALKTFVTGHPEMQSRLRQARSFLDSQACLNAPVEAVILANMMVEQNRTYHILPSDYSLTDLLILLKSVGAPIFTGTEESPLERELELSTQSAELRMSVDRQENGLVVRARLVWGDHSVSIGSEDIQTITPSPLWLIAGEHLFPVQEQVDDLLEIFFDSPEIFIPKLEENDFLDKFLLELARRVTLEGNAIEWETVDCQPIPRLYLNEVGGTLQAQLRFAYGEIEVRFNGDAPVQTVRRKNGSWSLVRILRKPVAEEAAYNFLSSGSHSLKRAPLPAPIGTFRLRARANLVDFLLHGVPRLVRHGFEVYGEEQIKSARVNRHTPSISFQISSGIDWFDVNANISFGDIQLAVKDFRRAIRKKERFVKLADGSIGEIPADWIDRFKHLFALGEEVGEGTRLGRFQHAILDELAAEAAQWNVDEGYNQFTQLIQMFNQVEFKGVTSRALPEGFSGDLRPYQKAGYDWLHFLRDFHFGGCLADDMGLGKTVQALAFLQSLYVEPGQGTGQNASLLVVPRSLLVNWQREASRFTPQLRMLEYFDSDRIKSADVFKDVDVVITTYGVMLRDIAVLHGYTFHYAILDESQVIKNPLSQTAKASRLLKAQHRLVLTGTPIENSTVELWSQFSFLNPGLLGSLEYFRNEFGTPIEKKNDQAAARLLRKMVYPFILRRTKDQVAPELPPRTDRILYSDMEPAQFKVYQRLRDYYRGMLLGMIDQEGLNKSRMHILEGLLRLRQVSNHPALVDEKYRGGSGKYELLLDTLETLRAEGHKALVFSQFVKMLSLVKQELDKRRIPYAYLDGATRDRQERIDAFQKDKSLPFFLISLKAGGLGLNLTAADYVIHIDPWWNPAVETQASDRTHRIGQEKPVFVFKLIARDSVEEKILLLQERKRELVNQIITTDSSFFKELTVEDVKELFS